MKEFVLLDLDDTILDFHKAERRALKKALLDMGLTPEEAVLSRYSEINAAQWRLLEQGKLNREQVKLRRYQLLFEEFGVQGVEPVKMARTYERYLGEGHFFLDGAEQLLKALHADYRLFLVSNGTYSIQQPRIQSANIARFFEKIFISETVGFNKPDKAFFDAVFAEIPQFQKEKAVIIGDSLSSDIQGGKNAGITTVWLQHEGVKNNGAVQPDHTVTDLSQIPTLLRAL